MRIGIPVVVTDGEFRGWEGRVHSVGTDGRVIVTFQVFGRDVNLEIDADVLSTDVDGFRQRQRATEDRRRIRWIRRVCREVGTEFPPDVPADLVGPYFQPDPAASGLRLTLGAEGCLTLERWADLGGRWIPVWSGYFVVLDQRIESDIRELSFCETSFSQDGVLHVRRVNGRIVLVPTSALERFDELLKSPPSDIDRLDETFFGLQLFFRTDDESESALR